MRNSKPLEGYIKLAFTTSNADSNWSSCSACLQAVQSDPHKYTIDMSNGYGLLGVVHIATIDGDLVCGGAV